MVQNHVWRNTHVLFYIPRKRENMMEKRCKNYIRSIHKSITNQWKIHARKNYESDKQLPEMDPKRDPKRVKKYTKLKMICTNPDLIVHRGSSKEYCAGTLAAIFEELGGKVIYFGKPYPEIYNFCIKKNETVLAIGDNIRTDIRGANQMKFDSLFITGGIHKKEFLNLPIYNYDKVLIKYKTKTNYYQEILSW